MAAVFQLAVSARNARLDAIETDLGVSPILRLRSGALPVNCAAADAGTVLAVVNLPSDWMAAASGGSKSMNSLPQSDSSADATGTAGHFRIYTSGGVCKQQGNVTDPTDTPNDGAMTLDNKSLVAGQQFNITNFTLTDGNA